MLIGIEIGGTKLQAALGRGDGTILRLARVRVDPANGREGICRQLDVLAPSLLREAGLAAAVLTGVGIGFGGPVNGLRGVVCKSHQVAGWEDFPLVGWFQATLGLRAV